ARHGSTRGPCARAEMNAPVARELQPLRETISQRSAGRGIQRRDVAARWAGAGEKRRPEIVERRKVRRNLECVRLYVFKPRGLELRRQRPLSADGKPSSLVELRGASVERDGLAPEETQELHAVGVVPDIRRECRTGAKTLADRRHGVAR